KRRIRLRAIKNGDPKIAVFTDDVSSRTQAAFRTGRRTRTDFRAPERTLTLLMPLRSFASCLCTGFFAEDLRATDFRATDLRAMLLRAGDLRATDFRATDFRATLLRATLLRATLLRAT